jgi:hypothetical protein
MAPDLTHMMSGSGTSSAIRACRSLGAGSG